MFFNDLFKTNAKWNKGEINVAETYELYDYEEKNDEIIYTLKHSDSSNYKFSELKIYKDVDIKQILSNF